ncbi:MAG: ATP synthase F1 subunit gamma [Armatimonadota bacterium]
MASNLRAIRRKIKAVGNIWQITRAMQMVSTSKLKKAQPRVEASREYLRRLSEITASVAGNVPADLHPYLQHRPIVAQGLIVVAGDKGLAGSHNANILRAAEEYIAAQDVPVKVITVGVRAGEYGQRRGWNIVHRLDSPNDSTQSREALEIARLARRMFDDSEIDVLRVAYTQFISVLRRPPTITQLLPIVGNGEDVEGTAEYIFSPPAEELLGALLPRTVDAQIVNMLLQAVAAEHAARMTAMTAATENADELRGTLSRQLNRARQTQITTELLEVIAGADALAQGD